MDEGPPLVLPALLPALLLPPPPPLADEGDQDWADSPAGWLLPPPPATLAAVFGRTPCRRLARGLRITSSPPPPLAPPPLLPLPNTRQLPRRILGLWLEGTRSESPRRGRGLPRWLLPQVDSSSALLPAPRGHSLELSDW